ncbi:cobalamin-binding protein [Thioalkalivibrio denitrificans]|uniref:Cobalamin-binding protein n=1 Tax=Thioalkalivibrio denitrificans TaxID=108003 RepID=A0A1V3NJH7_9GAMM|nr:cobalamin-binding protein [Thioalkalivibrio denitrificans]OOG25220.1 cobalamin-binding protein [Thioalkalivibrio denitrificans]
MSLVRFVSTRPGPWLWLLSLLAGSAVLAGGGAAVQAEIRVTDDSHREVRLAEPAHRIVSLSPHLTELLFEVGAGDRIVGTVSFSDHPEAARQIPRVGNAGQLDLERILALQPDLVVAWRSGNPARQVARLEALGLTVYYNEPRRLSDLADTLERLAVLTGSSETGAAQAAQLRERSRKLATRYAHRPAVPLFYQIWDDPLMTVNDQHLIGELIALCGGKNLFGELPALVPRLSREAVLAADPEVIVGGGSGEDNRAWVDGWRRWSGLTAVRRDNLFFIPPSLIQRQTPRILDGAEMLCEYLDEARARRPETAP